MASDSNQLTAAARRHLRKLGRACRPGLHAGKADVSDGFIQKLDELLSQHELVKIKALDAAASSPDELAERMGSATGSTVVTIVGRTVLLYRPNPNLAKDKRVRLP